jgi:hypothetical protein
VWWELDRRGRWEKRQTLPPGKRSLSQALCSTFSALCTLHLYPQYPQYPQYLLHPQPQYSQYL